MPLLELPVLPEFRLLVSVFPLELEPEFMPPGLVAPPEFSPDELVL